MVVAALVAVVLVAAGGYAYLASTGHRETGGAAGTSEPGPSTAPGLVEVPGGAEPSAPPSGPAPTGSGSPGASPKPGPAAPPAGWTLVWSPEAARDGLGAFEGVEDDRAGSEPGVKHIYVQGDDFRFDMHMVQRDTSPDRQRNEVKGMRSGGKVLTMSLGETWRFAYSMFIPRSLQATTTFTHIMQLKMPGSGSAPILVMSLRRSGGVPTIEVKVFGSNTLVGRAALAPLQDRWIDTELEVRIGNAPDGYVRWKLTAGSSTVVDAAQSNVDTWLDDRVRPKWGIYRSLGDTSGSLQDCYLLLTRMRAYRKQ